MSDSSDVDAALIAKLQTDATLAALTPGGWFMDEAPAGLTQFGIVSLVDEHDEPMFGGRAFEDATYLVTFIELSTVAVKNAKAAAARIDALLEQGSLTIAGYGLMLLRRDSRVRSTEVDELDSSIRWFHRGGRYQVVVSA
jgi:hypothetical protein